MKQKQEKSQRFQPVKPVRNSFHMSLFPHIYSFHRWVFIVYLLTGVFMFVKDKQRRELDFSLWLDQRIACRGITSSQTPLKPPLHADGGDTVSPGTPSN